MNLKDDNAKQRTLNLCSYSDKNALKDYGIYIPYVKLD